MFKIGEMILGDSMMSTDNPTKRKLRLINLFNNESRYGRTNRFLACLLGRPDMLEVLPYTVKNGHYLGICTVALDQIHGSESRSIDFDYDFHPLHGRIRNRWVSVALARQNGVVLAPVELIHVGSNYFVRDGHHRISVAHAIGESFIEADVIGWEM
jgi:hypothetical protein